MHHHHIYQAQKDIFALISFGNVTNWLGLQCHRNIFLPFLGHLFLFTLMTFRLQTIIRLVGILINCLRLSGKKHRRMKCFCSVFFQLENMKRASLPITFSIKYSSASRFKRVKSIDRSG